MHCISYSNSLEAKPVSKELTAECPYLAAGVLLEMRVSLPEEVKHSETVFFDAV